MMNSAKDLPPDMILIPVLPLLLAIAGLALAFGVGAALMVFAARYAAPSPRALLRVTALLLVGVVFALSALVAAMITYLPWDAP
jgi:hypothetical protein